VSGQFVHERLDILSESQIVQCGKSLDFFNRPVGTTIALISVTEREGLPLRKHKDRQQIDPAATDGVLGALRR
jgi:hypothetical protein